MNNAITITPGQIVAICAGFSAICVAVGWVLKIIKAAKAPTKALEDRIEALERINGQHADYLANDKRRIDAIEEGNRVTQRAILALLSHGIDGNDVDGLKAAKSDLQKYLIERT